MIDQSLNFVGSSAIQPNFTLSEAMHEMNPGYGFPAVTMNLDLESLDEVADQYDDAPADVEFGTVSLDDSHLMLTSPVVYGLSLEDKLWRAYY